jgi:hypothetical protein
MTKRSYPVGGQTIVITTTPTLTESSSYVSGDYIGTTSDEMEFANCALYAGGGGWISGAVLIDYALQSVACELWIFDTAITAPADSAAWTVTDAMAKTLVCVIPFSTYYASAANSIAMNADNPRKFICASGSTSLYGAIVTRGAPTLASGDYTIRLFIDQD